MVERLETFSNLDDLQLPDLERGLSENRGGVCYRPRPFPLIDMAKMPILMKKIIRTRDVRVDEIVRRKIRMQTLGMLQKDAWKLPPQGNKKLFWKVVKDGEWKGSRCFVIGGGPSITGFDFERLRGEKIIAINKAYEYCDFADIMFSMDSRYYNGIVRGFLGSKAKRKFDAFKGYKVWLDTMNFRYNDIYYLMKAGDFGLSLSMEDGLRHGNNSGYAAVNLAFCLGANPIYLLGYDMKHKSNGQTHFHEGYPWGQNPGQARAFAQGFDEMVPVLKDKGIRVINLNPDSALKCFPRKAINEVLQ